MNFKKILAISPHTDDIELSSAATIAKYISSGVDVYYVGLSDCRDTLINTEFSPDTLEKECQSALKTIGIKQKNIFIHHHTNKLYSQEARSIFETLEGIKNKIHPDVILMPDLHETHQDHKTVAEQALTVFRRDTSIICYEEPWNSIDFTPNFFVSVSAKHLSLKLKALKQYKTQFTFKRPYLSKKFIYGLASARGIQINKPYAEAFKVLKLIS